MEIIDNRMKEQINEYEEDVEDMVIDFLCKDEKFQDFITENYILLEMDNLEDNLEDPANIKKVVYPMRREEFEKLKEIGGLDTVRKLMEKKMRNEENESDSGSTPISSTEELSKEE